jgi:hypothetical protein
VSFVLYQIITINIDVVVSILREEGEVDVFGARRWVPDSSDDEEDSDEDEDHEI